MAPAAEHGAVEDRLRDLIARGFQFLHPRDAEGELVAVVGVRAHHNVVDVLQLHAEDDATAFRIPGDERDIMAPSTTLWRCSGAAIEVLNALLALADPAPAAQTGDAAKGCWVPVRPGRARWVRATA
ncbi:hypothetical protein [Gandjariella thermophila]|uniref:Uncharacterized protein n=1 Tax=Gandjariella thermophila TaxID=1931992 RepID=A0A4D4J4X5_9PSEU|nr:hypothetical protein [Gandjariella thermophila]GDY29586.1 hypothetical protein GTS_12190 [Gandjariella thermophila]